MSANQLNIRGYGYFGESTGNLIYESLHQKGKSYEAEYNNTLDKIIVLSSSTLSEAALTKMLYAFEFGPKYQGWFPKVCKKRDERGNLLIKLSSFIPKEVSHASKIDHRFIQKPTNKLSRRPRHSQIAPTTIRVPQREPFSRRILDTPEILETNKKQLTLLLKASAIVCETIDKVSTSPEKYFKLPFPTVDLKPQFISLPVKLDPISGCGAEKSLSLNFMLASNEQAREIHSERGLLLGFQNHDKIPLIFGFKEVKLADTKHILISFPGNQLFNELIKKLPPIISCGLSSTYQAIGEVSPYTHVSNWVNNNSWPYDGEAKTISRMMNTLHDAHHIVISLKSNHLIANIKLFLRQELQKVDKSFLLDTKTISSISGKLEMLHNYAHDLVEKDFWVDERSGYLRCREKSLFNGVLKNTDTPCPLLESEADYSLRKKIFLKLRC